MPARITPAGITCTVLFGLVLRALNSAGEQRASASKVGGFESAGAHDQISGVSLNSRDGYRHQPARLRSAAARTDSGIIEYKSSATVGCTMTSSTIALIAPNTGSTTSAASPSR